MTTKKTEPLNNEEIPVAEAQPTYTNWVKQVMDELLGAEKKWFELASEQNALTLRTVREGVELYRTTPAMPLTNWAKQGLENLLEIQKKWLENATQQRNQLLNQGAEATAATLANEGDAATAGRFIPDFARQQLDSLIEARRRWLDFAEQQNTQFIQGLQETLGLKEPSVPASLTRMSQQLLDNYLEAQKRWLGFITPAPSVPQTDSVA
jgi:hypothetical protein